MSSAGRDRSTTHAVEGSPTAAWGFGKPRPSRVRRGSISSALMAQTEASRQLVLEYFLAADAGDPAALARVLADDIEWVPPQYVWIFTCSGGQIVRMEEHSDTLRFQRIVIDD